MILSFRNDVRTASASSTPSCHQAIDGQSCGRARPVPTERSPGSTLIPLHDRVGLQPGPETGIPHGLVASPGPPCSTSTTGLARSSPRMVTHCSMPPPSGISLRRCHGAPRWRSRGRSARERSRTPRRASSVRRRSRVGVPASVRDSIARERHQTERASHSGCAFSPHSHNGHTTSTAIVWLISTPEELRYAITRSGTSRPRVLRRALLPAARAVTLTFSFIDLTSGCRLQEVSFAESRTRSVRVRGFTLLRSRLLEGLEPGLPGVPTAGHADPRPCAHPDARAHSCDRRGAGMHAGPGRAGAFLLAQRRASTSPISTRPSSRPSAIIPSTSTWARRGDRAPTRS